MSDLEQGVAIGEEDLPSQLLSLSSSLSEPLNNNPPSSRPRRTMSYDSHELRNPSTPAGNIAPIESRENRNWRDLLPLPLFRRITSISAVGAPSSTEVFYCEICLENHPVTEATQFLGCQCRFCHFSLQTYFESQIREGYIEFFCPSCVTQVTEHEIQKIVSAEMYSKYSRFLEMKSNPSYRECPNCGHASIGSMDQLNMTCSECSESFCFLHSNAHPGRTCQQYMRAQRNIDAQNRATIKRMSRKCPSCGCDTEKSGGCNHMTCRACGEVSLLFLTLLCLLIVIDRVGAGFAAGISQESRHTTTLSQVALADNLLMLLSGHSGPSFLVFDHHVSITSLGYRTFSSFYSSSLAFLSSLSSPSSSLSPLSSSASPVSTADLMMTASPVAVFCMIPFFIS
jgi:hypothetical protein